MAGRGVHGCRQCAVPRGVEDAGGHRLREGAWLLPGAAAVRSVRSRFVERRSSSGSLRAVVAVVMPVVAGVAERHQQQ